MSKEIELLLITGVLESGESSEETNKLVIEAFKAAIKLILGDNNLFDRIPEIIYVSMNDFEEVEKKCENITGLEKDLVTDSGLQNESKIEYFYPNGVLLFDGIAASAFGRMNYIYRSKGIRLYLFEDNIIKVVIPYSTIDHDGFQLRHEPAFDIDVENINSIEDIDEFFSCLNKSNDDKIKRYSHEVIKILICLKKPFKRDFFLEYLLTPPDVDVLSDFSIKIKTSLWDVCFSDEFEDKWGKEIQNKTMILLTALGISPNNSQLITFIKKSSDKTNVKEISERIEQLEANLMNSVNAIGKQNNNIIDFKPNFYGIGLNFNEIYKRIISPIRKKK